MRIPRLVAVATLAAWAIACGDRPPTTLQIAASPASVNVGPGAFVTLTISGTFNGQPLLEGAEITVDTDFGSFSADGEEQSTTVTVAGQKASLKLYAPEKLNTSEKIANVHALYIDPYAIQVNATTTVKFKTATKAVKLNFSCTATNIGAFWDGVGDFGVKCRAVPEDENNEQVLGTKVSFLAEAGEFLPGDEPGTFIYDPHAGNRTPKDVTPLGDEATGEPRYVDTTAPGSPTRNPRDGLVTLVAYIEGESNGIYSTPYLDINDNDKFDAGEDMPPGVNEFQDSQDKYIWKQIKILWTSRTSLKTPIGTHVTMDATPLARGDSRTITYTLLDRNLNVLAANDESDLVTLDEPAYGTFTDTTLPVIHSMGIDMDSNFKIRNPSKRETYMQNSTYTVILQNNRTADDTDGDQTVTLTGHATHSLGTDETGVASMSSEEELPNVQLVLK